MQKSDNIKKKMGDEPQFGFHPHCEHVPVKNPKDVIQWLIEKYKCLKKQHLKDMEEILKRFAELTQDNNDLRNQLTNIKNLYQELNIKIENNINDLQILIDNQRKDLEEFKTTVPSLEDFNSLTDQVTVLNNQVLNFYDRLQNYYTKEEVDTKLDNLTHRFEDLQYKVITEYMSNRGGDLSHNHNEEGSLNNTFLTGWYYVRDGVVLIIGGAGEDQTQIWFPFDESQNPEYRHHEIKGDHFEWKPWVALTKLPEIPDVDLSNYFTKGEINELLSNLAEVDLSNYFTKGEINELLSNLPDVDVDLSNYYTKGEVDNKTSTTVVNRFNPDTGEAVDKSEKAQINSKWLVDQASVVDLIRDYNNKINALAEKVNLQATKITELENKEPESIKNINVYDLNGENAKYKELTMLPWNSMVNYYISDTELEEVFPFVDFGDLASGTLVTNISVLSLSDFLLCVTNQDSYIKIRAVGKWRKLNTTPVN